eukprot:1632764-Rhodomonas_salina.1
MAWDKADGETRMLGGIRAGCLSARRVRRHPTAPDTAQRRARRRIAGAVPCGREEGVPARDEQLHEERRQRGQRPP